MARQIQSTTKFVATLTGALLLLGFGFYLYFSYRTPEFPPAIPIYSKGQPTLGSKDAPVHIVVFEDPTCSTCKNYHTDIYPTLKKEYIDSGQVKYTVILVAFLPNSRPVAMSLFCAMAQSQGNFFALLNEFYKQSITQNTPPNEISGKIVSLAEKNKIYLNVEQMQTCVGSNTYAAEITQNTSYARDLMGGYIQTPTVYVNGMKIVNPSLQQLKTFIEHAEKKRKMRKK